MDMKTTIQSGNDLLQEIRTELEQSRRVLKELTLMVDQSQAELAKLTQRNAAITGHLQQVQARLETTSAEDIRSAYSAALDSQQRMLVMRGQLEKLQSEKSALEKLTGILEKIDGIMAEGGMSRLGKGGGTAMLETVINAQEAVRMRLSRQMHDGPAQTLSNFIVQMEIVTRLFDIDQVKARDELMHLKNSAMSTFQKVRAYIFELRPMTLDDLGLADTLKRYGEAFKEQNNADVTVTVTGQSKKYEPYFEVMIFRAVQELIYNAYHHNLDMTNRVSINVTVNMEDNLVKVAVSDSGKGFNPEEVEKSEGLGLKLLRERVEMLGGVLNIDSSMGQGAKISFELPVIERAA